MFSRLVMALIVSVSFNASADPIFSHEEFLKKNQKKILESIGNSTTLNRVEAPQETDEELVARAPKRSQDFYERQMKADAALPKDQQPIKIGNVVHYLCKEGLCSYDGITTQKSQVDIKSIRAFKGYSVGLENGKLKFRVAVGPWLDVVGGEDLAKLETSKHVIFGIDSKGALRAYLNTDPELLKFGMRGEQTGVDANGQAIVKYYPMFKGQEMKLENVGIENVADIKHAKDDNMNIIFKDGVARDFIQFLQERLQKK